ncbi:glutamate receptor ionotropic, kainate 3-like isoform X2 [Ptychodera flava]|uniref:glutamate receptor ionotropic, kainate 3-like isoform X2 n=1 Tax=Ptychodera flava TaxID=63121 RepID=UPI003969E64A
MSSDHYIRLVLCIACLYLHVGQQVAEKSAHASIVTSFGVVYCDRNATIVRHSVSKALEYVNKDNQTLKDVTLFGLQKYFDSYPLLKRAISACDLVSDNVAAIMVSDSCKSHLKDIFYITHHLEIPTIIADHFFIDDIATPYTISMFPSQRLFTHALMDVLTYYDWKDFVIVYDDILGFRDLEYFFMASGRESWKIKVKKISIRALGESVIMDVLQDVRSSGIRQIVAHCHHSIIPLVLRYAMRLAMVNIRYSWVFTDLQASFANIEEFQYSQVNLTMFALGQASLHNTAPYSIHGDWLTSLNKENGLQEMLVYDAIRALAQALENMVKDGRTIRTQTKMCSGKEIEVVDNGAKIMKYFKEVQFEGLTGVVNFTRNATRDDIELTILGLNDKGLQPMGIWTKDTDPLRLIASRRNGTFVFGSQPLRVTTIIEEPFIMERHNADEKGLTGADRYEGYCIDMLYALSEMMDFKFELELVKDGKFGSMDENGEWNGLVRELQDNADLAVAPLTISSEREQAIDFTKPYMTLGISVLIKKPGEAKPGYFAFLQPLSNIVWVSVIATYLSISFILFTINRTSPYEWKRLSDRGIVAKADAGNLDYLNSLWWCFGSFMQQGVDYSPKSTAARVVGGTWWLFTLFLVTSYTANMAAFLTITRLDTPVRSVEDLVSQSKIMYGTVVNSQPLSFFSSSKNFLYNRMFSYMDSTPGAIVQNTSDGVARVRAGGYALLWDSTVNEYLVQKQPCDLMTVGSTFDLKGYGIGLPMGAPYRDDFTIAVLKLREKGFLENIQKKWWTDRGECPKTEMVGTSDIPTQLGFDQFSGMFCVVGAGAGLGLLTSLIENLVYLRKNQIKQRKKRRAAQKQGLPYNGVRYGSRLAEFDPVDDRVSTV